MAGMKQENTKEKCPSTFLKHHPTQRTPDRKCSHSHVLRVGSPARALALGGDAAELNVRRTTAVKRTRVGVGGAWGKSCTYHTAV